MRSPAGGLGRQRRRCASAPARRPRPAHARRQAKDWEAKLAVLERQHLADKERWRREVAARIKETRLQMAQLAGEAPLRRPGSVCGGPGAATVGSTTDVADTLCDQHALPRRRDPPSAAPTPADQHLEGTTKRAILENEAMVSELAYHSGQSARLMAANAQLRGDAAHLRRQAAIAQRTGAAGAGAHQARSEARPAGRGKRWLTPAHPHACRCAAESMSRKNTALQRIIKAILAKLREEGTQAAALAVATAGGSSVGYGGCASPLPQGAGLLCMQALEEGASGRSSPLSRAVSPGAGLEPLAEDSARAGAPGAPQRQPLQGGGADWFEPKPSAQALRGNGGGGAGRAAAAPVVCKLAERVCALEEELEAARQALASAAGVTLTHSPQAPAPAPARASGARGRGGRGASKAGGRGGGGGSGSGSVACALENGVAAFVLHAVSQLRRQAQPQAAGARSAPQEGRLDAAAAETLARALLDLLHSYSAQTAAAFSGFGVDPSKEEGAGGAGAVVTAPAPVPSPAPAPGAAREGLLAGPAGGLLGAGEECALPLPSVEEILMASAAEAKAASRRGTPEPHGWSPPPARGALGRVAPPGARGACGPG
jgi:hypothetical protein